MEFYYKMKSSKPKLLRELVNKKNALLILENGDLYWGNGIGAKGRTIGELCFNTSMTGYQEIISDPSYAEQIITFTFPHIGNTGTNINDNESNVPAAKGDILVALSEEAKDAKAQLNDATANAMDLAEKVKAFERKDIVAEACKGLAATEEAKLRELTEAVEADDNESYAAKVATIKESYLNKDTTVEATPEVDAITEDTDTQEPKVIDANMQQYLSAIERTQSIS